MDNARPPADNEEPLLLDNVCVEEEQDQTLNTPPNTTRTIIVSIVGTVALIVLFGLFHD